MADGMHITVNDQQVKFALQGFTKKVGPEPLLKIFAAVMATSRNKTFREQGSPAGSWPALAASTLKARRFKPGDKMLIRSGRLKNSIASSSKVEGGKGTLLIGTNLAYAPIHQRGGYAGRRSASAKSKARFARKQKRGFHGPASFRRPFIPARPYLVFRPEDPAQMEKAAEAFIQSQAKGSGL